MAIYEYECNECDHSFEKIQKMNDEPLLECPICGFFTLDKVVSKKSSFRIGGLGVHNPTTHWGDPS